MGEAQVRDTYEAGGMHLQAFSPLVDRQFLSLLDCLRAAGRQGRGAACRSLFCGMCDQPLVEFAVFVLACVARLCMHVHGTVV